MAEFLLNFLGFPILAFVCGVGFLLLSLCYLKRNSCFPVFWKQRNVNQRQGRAKRRRKGGTSKGSRACQSEAEEERKVLSLLQSPLGRHDDTTRFRQLLCPDPFCEVCNNATAEVNWLLYPEALEDATSSASPLVSTSPVTESSFTLSPAFSVVPLGDLAPASLSEPSPLPPSSLSPNPMTPLVDFFSPSPLGHSLAPESFPSLDSEFPVDYSSPQPLAFPPLLTHDTQTADPVVPAEGTMPLNTIFSLDPTFSQDINSLPVLSQAVNPPDSFACHHAPPTLPVSPQPDCTLTVTQSKSFAILLKPVLEKSPPDSPAGLSACVPTIRGTDHSSLSTSDFSWWQAHANTVFLPTLSHSDFQREPVSFHIPETCLWGDSITKHMEAMSHSFLGLNIQELLERQIKKKMAFQHLEKKEKEEASFSKQMWSEYQQTSSENSLQSLDTQDSTALQAGWNTESKSEQLHICQQLPYVKTLGENLPQKYHQLFWGLPSLHSESLVATLLVSSRGFPLEPHFILFNGIYNTSAVKMQDQESSPLLHSHPRPLPSVHPQPLPQTMPQSQPLIFSQVWPQVHLQSRLPILPSSPSQVGDCGVSFHRFQNESDFHIATENQYLERHVLQTQKGSFCGLVPVLQKSQEATCPQAPNLPLVSRSPHTYVPVSILPGHFHIIPGEPQEKLELHVPRRLIPRWYLQACRNLESTTLTVPQCKLTEVPQQKSTHVHLQLSELQGQSRNNVGKSQLGLPGSFHERVPTQFQLRNDMRKNLGYILEKGPEDSPQRVSGCYLVHNLRAALETKSNCVCHSRNHLGNELLNVSRKDTDWNQTKTILRLHVSTKSWQITAGRIPIGVCRSWLADDSTWPLSGSSQTNMEDTNSKNTMVGKVYSQISTLELSFLDPNTLKVLEAHILRFRVSQRWGLPLKVLESIKFYILRETKTWPLPQFDFPSSTIHISGVDSKGEVSKLLEGSSKTSQGSKVRTTNSVTMLDRPLPVISSVGNEGQGTLQPSHSDIDQKLAGNIQTIERGRQTFQLLTHRDKDKVSQRETVRDNRCTSEVPIRQAGGRHEPRDENVNSSDRVEMIQGQKMWEKNLEHSFMSNMPSETFKAKKLCALKSRSCDILTTSKLESSQMTNVNTNKVETTLTTQFPSPKMFVPQDSKVSDLHKQLFSELKFKLESEKHSLAQHCPTDMPLTSDSLPSKSSLTHAQGISSGDTAASQVLHVHLEDSGISTEQWRDPSKHVLWKCPDKRVRPLGSKAGEYRSEDSGKGTSKARKKSHPVENQELKDTSPSLSQNEQLPPESYFKKKMRQFFQWIDCKRKIKDQESPQQKAKFMSTSVQHQDSVESAAVFVNYGPPEAQELMTAIGKILEEKLAHRFESETSELSQHKKELQTQGEPDQAHPFNCGDLSDSQQEEWASTKSSNQEDVSADQSCLTSVRQNRDRIRHHQKVVAFEDQVLCQTQPSSLSSREPVLHPSPTCMHEECQVPSATLTPDKGTVFRDLSLLFKPKLLLQHFQGEKISP